MKKYPRILVFVLFVVTVSFSLALTSCGGESDDSPVVVDTTPPSLSATSPADGATNVVVTTAISITFNEVMAPYTLTANTADADCLGTLQLSSNNFISCVQFSSNPVASNGNKTFAITPASNLSVSTTYVIKVTHYVEDDSGNNLESTYSQATGFATQP